MNNFHPLGVVGRGSEIQLLHLCIYFSPICFLLMNKYCGPSPKIYPDSSEPRSLIVELKQIRPMDTVKQALRANVKYKLLFSFISPLHCFQHIIR